jgi:peptidyl-prolyl cis-trans isomerase C
VNHVSVLIAAALGSLALSGCNTPTATCPPVGAVGNAGERVLTVNGHEVGAKELDLVFRRMQIPEEKRADYAWTTGGKHVAEEYALATLLYERALKENILDDPELQLQLAFLERQFLSSAMRDRLAKAAVTDEAIQKWYESKKDVFEKPEAKVRQILVSTAPLADSMLERLKKGEDFAALAKAHSIDQETAPRGGELGWIKEGEDRNIGKEVLAAGKGDLLGPIESRLGFHVVEVLEKRELTPLEDVKPLASMALANEEATRVLEDMRQSMTLKWDREPEAGSAPAGGAMPPAGGDGASPHGAPGEGGAPPPPQHGAEGGAPPPQHGAPAGGDAASPHGAPAGAASPHGGAPAGSAAPHGAGG